MTKDVNMFILLCMIFMHIVDDYYFQGILSYMKQKEWWINQKRYSEKYSKDYIVVLIAHSFSWTFSIMLPIAIYNLFVLDATFYLFFAINIIVHAIIDNEKANKYRINLVQDQFIHLAQIVITFWECF